MSYSVQFEYDPEKLIKEIEKRPGLWCRSSLAHRNRPVRQKLWKEIAAVLCSESRPMSKSETTELINQLQKKWKGIRDYYIKYRVNPKKQRRPYVYYSILQFLDGAYAKGPIPNSRDCDEDASSASSDDLQVRVKKKAVIHVSSHDSGHSSNKGWAKRIKTETTDDDDDDDNDTNDNEESACYIPPYHADTSNNALDNNEVNKTHYVEISNPRNAVPDEDSDKMFLMSLLPHLKAIPQEFRLDAKVELMHVLRNAKMSNGENRYS